MNTLTPVMRTVTGLGEVAEVTATLTLRSGTLVYLCNSFADLEAAMDANKSFIGHDVIGMEPREIIINPRNVATIGRAK